MQFLFLFFRNTLILNLFHVLAGNSWKSLTAEIIYVLKRDENDISPHLFLVHNRLSRLLRPVSVSLMLPCLIPNVFSSSSLL